jgi:diguanylate cyclase (GGDEF)-like protein/PAS domain S-box-containing protein
MENDAMPALPMRPQLDSGAARERLRHEQACFDELYLLAPFGHFVVGIDGAIVRANLAGASMLGFTRKSAARHRLRSFVAPQSRAAFDECFRTALNSTGPASCELALCLRNPEVTAQVTLEASADGSGQACRVVLEPVEGRVAALERSEERFRRIVHCAGEGIWEVDADGITRFVNPKMADLLGYEIEDMLGQPFTDFVDAEGRAMVGRSVARRKRGVVERNELLLRRKDGSAMWASVATNPIFGAAGESLGALALVNDITRQRASVERIWHQANYDELTGLPNRHMFLDRLRQAMRKADRDGAILALLFLDLDHFKDVNDRLGHAMGDLLLSEAAQRIGGCVRATDTIARLGGDEFTVILTGLDRAGMVDRIARSILAALAAPFTLGDESATISASIGVALYPADAREVGMLLEHADQAMYAAKNDGRNRYRYFKEEGAAG